MARQSFSTREIAVGIGIEVRRLRLRSKSRTQSALADSAGISISFLSMIERGERLPTIETLYRIASALRVRPNQLLI